MKTRLTDFLSETTPDYPTPAELATLRAWYEGAASREAVARYLGNFLANGKTARAMVGNIRRQMVTIARSRQRDDLLDLFQCDANERTRHAKAVVLAMDLLRKLPVASPQIADPIGLWLPARAVAALLAVGIETLSDLTVRIPRRRQWWTNIAGLGPASAHKIEAFFAAHPALTERARALIVAERKSVVMPWEQLQLPHEVDGSNGTFRAPPKTCTLSASNDYEAIQAWLALHESPATQRAYRKEAERLILWAIVERGKALSSLTVEDATDYRGFLRKPTPVNAGLARLE